MSLPPSPDEDSVLQTAREAHARHAWREAFDRLSAADAARSLSPDDLERLGEAAWWTGRLAACIAARERAYGGHTEAGNRRRAAVVAIELARDHFAKGESSVGSAWLNRADRLLQGEPESVEHGRLARMRAVVAFEGQGDLDAALGQAQRAFDIAAKFGDRDLMTLALHDRGRVLVAGGEVAAGQALMDEATVAAVAGELGPFVTAAIYCNTIVACVAVADYPRAGEWSEAAKRWCERQAISGFPGMCRVYQAGIMRQRGEWPEAAQQAQRACEELREFNLGYCASALYELGEIRLRMGNLAAAEDAFKQAHELGTDPEPGLSLLRLAEGKAKAAATSIRRALAAENLDHLHRARLLPAQVEIAIASGELTEAQAAADELESTAAVYGTPALLAGAAWARGAVALAQGDGPAAARVLRRAIRLWQEVNCPYEAARSRMLLASAYRAEADDEAALLELEAARSTLQRLGAALDVRRVDGLLGAAAAAGVRVARTFMFTDIVKSTNLVDAVGDEAWAALLQWHDQSLRALFARHHGEEIDHAGDGFFVAFPDAAAAVQCAIAIQRMLVDHRREHGFSPRVRIGVHSAAAQHYGAGYKGKGVHEAARIGALAGAEQIVASRATVEAARHLQISDPRSVQPPGLAEPIEIVTVQWQ